MPLLVRLVVMSLFLSEVTCFSCFYFYGSYFLGFVFIWLILAVVPYSAVVASAGKQVVSTAPSFRTTLSILSNKALIAELQAILRKSQDVADVLAGRASRLSEATRKLVAAKDANTQLKLEIGQLKEAVVGNKEALAMS